MPKQVKLANKSKFETIAISDTDRRRFQLHSMESGLTLTDVINQMLYLVHLRVQSAKDGAEIDRSMAGSEIELFTLLTLHDTGLLTNEEFARALVIANSYPQTDLAERIIVLREMIAERIELLRPHWQERHRQMAGQKILWGPHVADKTPTEAHVHFVSGDAE